MSAPTLCAVTDIYENAAWKRCAQHGAFPVWLGTCPGPETPSTGDPALDAAIDRLAGPFDSLGQRQIARAEAAKTLRHLPNRIDGGKR